jgi:limonene-1,2-epoxide hydrolase
VTTPDSALIVERAISALKAADYDTLASLLAEDVVYVNVGTPEARGRRTTMRIMRATRPFRMHVDILRSVTDGPVVLNERVDAIQYGRFRLQFWAYGVFEVHDGRITLWRDYFDFADVAVGTIRALAGVVVPALGRRPPVQARRS